MIIKLLQILGFGLGGLLVAIVSNVVLLRFSRSLGIRNKNDVVVRWSNESKPSLGGVSFFVVFVFAAVAYSMVFGEEPDVFRNKQFVGLFVAGSIAFLMGLADDAYNTRPLIKLFAQILCGLLFVWTGSHIELFHSFYLDSTVTVIWVVIVMNSLNMLDNMDGITGTTVLFILLTCLFSWWMIGGFNTNVWSLMNVAVIGAVLGFLTMNVNPSKLFMGDAGSQFIGLFVAYYGMEYLWNVPADWNTKMGSEIPSWIGLCIALVAFTPTAVDTLTVVINRLKKGKSPMVGGKDHTTHHLVYSGLTDKKVWYVFVIIGVISSILAIAMVNLVKLETILPIAFFLAYFVFVFIILYRNTIKFQAPKK
ncbi:MAG: undecaprenyl/decaprenyl-phosphate alpha-N-acetylglucosaminyl 1-phosphate transferase [Crocinitomicaceae bacterium]|nr:undecaprenyl/decaprenyl-phosphate alpha-N-acetylglucosaminyl 1-phosphate transferase [Crocinitomicaceae bacterium]